MGPKDAKRALRRGHKQRERQDNKCPSSAKGESSLHVTRKYGRVWNFARMRGCSGHQMESETWMWMIYVTGNGFLPGLASKVNISGALSLFIQMLLCCSLSNAL